MLEQYTVSFWAFWFVIFNLLLQTIIATGAHRKQAQYVPGVVDENLGHDSFVFRSHRTFQNSLENTPIMLFTVLLAMLVGLSPGLLAATFWTFALARFTHNVLYYAISTEKNPSPRSYFYAIALLSNVVLMVMIALHLIA